MNELNTLNINYDNVKNVRSQIRQKKGSEPYFADINTGSLVLTDYDNFPYNRWWRGEKYSSRPIVAEREAGWRPINNKCYKKIKKVGENKVNNCFETACSTVYPCVPGYLAKYSDRDALNVMLNNSCIVEYR
jgi:hypothetical protein